MGAKYFFQLRCARFRILTCHILILGLSTGYAAGLPNVVIIYADDMGFGDLGANNPASKIPTPNLDALASEGIRFTDGHSSSGICTPSRFALLTGQHHWRRFHKIVSAFGPSVFKPDDFTLAKMFKAKGYRTACVGKWHLGWDWSSLLKEGVPVPSRYVEGRPEYFDWSKPIAEGPLAQGFDYYFGDGTINFPPYCWIENDRVTEAPSKMVSSANFESKEGGMEFREGPMVEGWDPYQVLPTLTDKAVDWIGQQSANEPFFLYFPLPSPHAPIIPNDEYSGKTDAGAYGDFVYETDAMAGRVLDALEANGFSENTIVVFTSDNGPELYAFERSRLTGHWSSAPFRGLKRDVWEGGHRVPFIIRWPGKIQPGISHENISQVDLAATFAAVIGTPLKSNEAIDSYNLLPLLHGKAYEQPLRTATVQNTSEEVFALRQGEWVFINASDGGSIRYGKAPEWFNTLRGYSKQTTPGLLYNLKDDPGQRINLFDAHPEKVAEMKAWLDRYREGEGCAPHSK
jgi:arylsulfatase A-like enzyme